MECNKCCFQVVAVVLVVVLGTLAAVAVAEERSQSPIAAEFVSPDYYVCVEWYCCRLKGAPCRTYYDCCRQKCDMNTSNQLFTMDLVGTETGDVPKRYSMDMTKDFVPMSVFSQTSQGKLAVEGEILNKFDMRPHDENIENYGKLCREQTNKSMNKSRQVIDNDNGSHMRPMPGMIIAAVFNME
ncbi:uncharacterized protein LOC120172782 [Hibiscus syriacus]|uniref:uncharacterized protein LOC120172782 n=1 Tax=Hibiscus syriacus TaxID=106335 RepID=UPI0019228816|nr:uncharacterized protein LOC120172782 [Hibiscus syriacus]